MGGGGKRKKKSLVLSRGRVPFYDCGRPELCHFLIKVRLESGHDDVSLLLIDVQFAA